MCQQPNNIVANWRNYCFKLLKYASVLPDMLKCYFEEHLCEPISLIQIYLFLIDYSFEGKPEAFQTLVLDKFEKFG